MYRFRIYVCIERGGRRRAALHRPVAVEEAVEAFAEDRAAALVGGAVADDRAVDLGVERAAAEGRVAVLDRAVDEIAALRAAQWT